MKSYVIISVGKRYVLKEKISEGFFGKGLFASKNLETIKDFANKNNFSVVAVGDIYDV